MWFFIKGAFWFSLVLLLLPLFDSQEKKETANTPGVEIGSTLTAATEALSYITAICAEKPDVCVEGAKTMEALGHRARDGARVAYSFLDDKLGEDEKADALETSGIPVPEKRPER